MTFPATNSSVAALTDPDWRRLSPRPQECAAASYELIEKARSYLQEGDLRQALEKGWGAAAQVVMAVAENWKEADVVHGRHQNLRALAAGLATADREPDLDMMFQSAQTLHDDLYENNPSQYIVNLHLRRVSEFIAPIALQLRCDRPPRGFRRGL